MGAFTWGQVAPGMNWPSCFLPSCFRGLGSRSFPLTINGLGCFEQLGFFGLLFRQSGSTHEITRLRLHVWRVSLLEERVPAAHQMLNESRQIKQATETLR